LPEIWNVYSDQRKAEDGWSRETLQEMHIPVERYQRYCDDNKLRPVPQSTAAGYPSVLVAQKTKRGNTMSVATVNQHLDRIGAAFRWAVDRGYAPADHFAKLKIELGARAKAAKGKRRHRTHMQKWRRCCPYSIPLQIHVIGPSSSACSAVVA